MSTGTDTMTENNNSPIMEDQHVVVDLAVDYVEILSTLPSIGASRAEYIVQLREQGNLNFATLAHTTCLSEAFYQNLVEKNLRPVASASHSTDTDASLAVSDKSTSGMDDLEAVDGRHERANECHVRGNARTNGQE